jgi:hypothetical protein
VPLELLNEIVSETKVDDAVWATSTELSVGVTALLSVEEAELEDPVIVEFPPLGTTVEVAMPIVRVIEVVSEIIYPDDSGADEISLDDAEVTVAEAMEE